MSWNYDNIILAKPAVAEPAATPEPARQNANVPAFSEDEMRSIKAAPAEVQTAIAGLLAQNLPSNDLILGVREALAASGQAPLGMDAMVAGPTGQGLGNALGIVETARESGRSTTTEQDIELTKIRVESQTKQLLASGASETEIQQAAAAAATTPELANVAKEVAQQQVDAEKFNLFSGAGNNEAQDNSMASFIGAGMRATVTAGTNPLALFAKDANVSADRMPFLDMGSTTLAIAAMGQSGFTPSNVPDVRQNIGIGRS